jgi:hypothetical protein
MIQKPAHKIFSSFLLAVSVSPNPAAQANSSKIRNFQQPRLRLQTQTAVAGKKKILNTAFPV